MPNSDKLVIVLDPGHGGENEGLKHNGLLEKDMNLVTATAMRDELLQYDNVEVYITNPDKTDMSLKARAQYAKDVGADILISLHFNMSENHEMYGSEVWIPSTGLGYSRMHSLGDVFMEQFQEQGFTLRGVKTRLNDRGTDYYGVIRESAALGIPCILVEHGYADHSRDFDKINDVADQQALGRSDATAVAKFFGLKSSSLGRDYSSYIQNGYFSPEQAIGSDVTAPEGVVLLYKETTEEGDIFTISAYDEQSEIVYYDYSVDGGVTWSEVFPFETGENAVDVCIRDIPHGGEVVARVYNGHFLHEKSNSVYYDEQVEIIYSAKPVAEMVQEQKIVPVTFSDPWWAYTGMYISLFTVVFSMLLFFAAFVTYKERMKVKRQSREERKAGFMSLGRMRQIENVCVLVGVIALIVGVTIFGIGFAKRQSEDVLVSSQETATESVYGQVVETVLPPKINVEKTEGYYLLEDDSIAIGEELLTIHQTNLEKGKEKDTVVVYDIAEGYMRVPLIKEISKNPYDLNGFSGEGMQMNYSAGDGVKVLKGIDVSKFQGNIDWEQVKQAGVDFAILRLGIRGYGSGEMVTDDRFMENYRGATEAGIKVGVYFFSAAIDEAEAVEEAEFVLGHLEDCVIEMPVVFDTEPIYYDDARTDDLTPNQLTAITKAFCNRIKQAGYEPMIYANSKRFTTVLHLEELEEYPKWLADYRNAPDYPYHFTMWQFTEKGTVPGISGNVDIDLYFYKE